MPGRATRQLAPVLAALAAALLSHAAHPADPASHPTPRPTPRHTPDPAGQTPTFAPATTYADVPTLFTQSPEDFRRIFGGAFSAATHAVILGDSQESCPGGRGDVYIPRLNAEFWTRYRASPSTPWTTACTSYGGGSPWGHWLLRAAYAPPGMTATRIPADRLPPGFAAGKTSTRGGPNINDNQAFGQLYMLQPGCESVNPAAVLAGQSYFDASGGVWLDVMAATNPSSGEVSVRIQPNATPTPNFYAPPIAVVSTAMRLQSPDPGVRTQRLGPFVLQPGLYMQAEVAGTDPARFTDVIAVRFVGAARRGLAVTPVSHGGYRSDTLLSAQPGCGEVVAAMGPNVAFLAYGANDVANYTSPEAYRRNVEDLIAWLRFWNGPDFPVVLLAETARGGLDDRQREAFDRYPVMNQRIAENDPLVCAVNTRRLAEAQGWTYGNLAPFMVDEAHYSPAGAILKARLEVEALMAAFSRTRLDLHELAAGGVSTGPTLAMQGVIGQSFVRALTGPTLRLDQGLLHDESPPPCPADFNRDGFIDFFDYDDYVLCYQGVGCPNPGAADTNRDGFVDFFDYDLFAELFEHGC